MSVVIAGFFVYLTFFLLSSWTERYKCNQAVFNNEHGCAKQNRQYHTKVTQSAFTCSKLTIEMLKQGVKYVQS